MEGYNRMHDWQRKQVRELTGSYQKLRDELLEEGQRRIEGFQDGQNRLNAEIEAKQQLLRGKLDELAKYWDRFM